MFTKIKSLFDSDKKNKKNAHLKSGAEAEIRARKFMQAKGFETIDTNVYSRFGEIDIIMIRDQELVFVEVRYRKNQNFGGAIASVDRFKQAKLRRTAETYLLKSKNHDCPCRFDILCISGNINKPELHWIKNAF